MAGLFDRPTDYVDYTSIQTPSQELQVPIGSAADKKIAKLSDRAVAKEAKLGIDNTFQQDTLLGMSDADSLRTQNALAHGLDHTRNSAEDVKGATRSVIAPDAYNYDAVEIAHGSRGGMQAALNNKYKSTSQPLQVATILNKDINSLTEQDFIDVGNMQQIQKLSDLGLQPGEDRWQAPLIRNVEQTNLTGHYVDEFDRPTDIPLDVQLQSKYQGPGTYRPLYTFGNEAGTNITAQAAADPLLNASLYKEGIATTGTMQAKTGPTELDKFYESSDSKSGLNWLDAAQFGVGRLAAGVGDVLVDAVTRGGLEAYKAYSGATEEEAVKSLVDNSSLFKRDPKTGDFIGLDKYKLGEEYGFDDSDIQSATAKLKESYKSGDVGDMLYAIADGAVTAGPEVLLSSLGELMAFGGAGALAKGGAKLAAVGFGRTAAAAEATAATAFPSVAANYSNQIMEERLKNLDADEKLTNSDRLFSTLTGTAAAALSKVGADEILGNTKVVKSIADMAFKTKSESAVKQVLSSLAKAGAVTSGKAGYEGLEEVAQDTVQKFGEKFGTKAEKELLSSEIGQDLFVSFGLGVGGGGAPASIGAAKTAASEIKGVGESVLEDITTTASAKENALNIEDSVQAADTRDIESVNLQLAKDNLDVTTKAKDKIADVTSTQELLDVIEASDQPLQTRVYVEEALSRPDLSVYALNDLKDAVSSELDKATKSYSKDIKNLTKNVKAIDTVLDEGLLPDAVNYTDEEITKGDKSATPKFEGKALEDEIARLDTIVAEGSAVDASVESRRDALKAHKASEGKSTTVEDIKAPEQSIDEAKERIVKAKEAFKKADRKSPEFTAVKDELNNARADLNKLTAKEPEVTVGEDDRAKQVAAKKAKVKSDRLLSQAADISKRTELEQSVKGREQVKAFEEKASTVSGNNALIASFKANIENGTDVAANESYIKEAEGRIDSINKKSTGEEVSKEAEELAATVGHEGIKPTRKLAALKQTYTDKQASLEEALSLQRSKFNEFKDSDKQKAKAAGTAGTRINDELTKVNVKIAKIDERLSSVKVEAKKKEAVTSEVKKEVKKTGKEYEADIAEITQKLSDATLTDAAKKELLVERHVKKKELREIRKRAKKYRDDAIAKKKQAELDAIAANETDDVNDRKELDAIEARLLAADEGIDYSDASKEQVAAIRYAAKNAPTRKGGDGFIKRFIKNIANDKGSNKAIINGFNNRLQRASTQAVEMLNNDEAINELAESLKDSDGKFTVSAKDIKKVINAKLVGRKASLKYFNAPSTRKADETVSTNKFNEATSAVIGKVHEIEKAIEADKDLSDETKADISSKGKEVEEMLFDFMDMFPSLPKSQLEELQDGKLVAQLFDPIKGTAIHSSVVNKFTKSVTAHAAKVLETKNTPLVRRSSVLEVARSRTVENNQDIIEAKKELDSLITDGKIDTATGTTLHRLLDKVKARSDKLLVKEREEHEAVVKEKEATISADIDAKIDEDDSLPTGAKEFFKSLPLTMRLQLGATSDISEDADSYLEDLGIPLPFTKAFKEHVREVACT